MAEYLKLKYMPGQCARCENKVEKKGGVFNKYCSKECRSRRKICATCHKDFKPRRDSNKYCSKKCMGVEYSKSARRRDECICRNCHTKFIPKAPDRTTFCSKECSSAKQKHNALFTQYIRTQKRIYLKGCEVCGKSFAKLNVLKKYCSKLCRQRSKDIGVHGRNQKERACRCCGNIFTPVYGCKNKMVCSELCRISQAKQAKRVHKAIRRARIKGVNSEPIDPYKIFARDGWRCQICKKKTPLTRRGSVHPRAPELDHIIPLSRGGSHTKVNVQCTCRACNLLKSDKVYGQMRLFG